MGLSSAGATPAGIDLPAHGEMAAWTKLQTNQPLTKHCAGETHYRGQTAAAGDDTLANPRHCCTIGGTYRGGRCRIGGPAAGQLFAAPTQGCAQDPRLSHHPQWRGAHQQRPCQRRHPGECGRPGAPAARARVRKNGRQGRAPCTGPRIPAAAGGRAPHCHRQTRRHGRARRQRRELWRDRATAPGTTAGPLSGAGAPAGPRNLGHFAGGQEAQRAHAVAGPVPPARDRQDLSGPGGGRLACAQKAHRHAVAQIPAARW